MPYQMPVVQNPRNAGINPVASGVTNFFSSLADQYAGREKENAAAAQKEAYYKYLEMMLDKKLAAQEPLNEARTKKARKEAEAPSKSTVAADKLSFERDRLSLQDLKNAEDAYEKFLRARAPSSNLMAGSMMPNDPRAVKMAQDLNAEFAQGNQGAWNLIKHGKDIRAAIAKRNPSLVGISLNDTNPTVPKPTDEGAVPDFSQLPVTQPGQ